MGGGGAVRYPRDHHSWRWEIRGKSTQQRSSRRPRDQHRGDPLHAPLREDEALGRPTVRISQRSRHVGVNGGYDNAWGRGNAAKRQVGDSRGFLSEKGEKKTFRDLFSPKEVEEGGNWTEVRRKRVNRPPRERSPIIKRPCFRCGLGGHIRRNCPRKLKMRCYGCNSASHLIRNCTAILRPEETTVELKTVTNITTRVQHLCKYAIF